MPELSPTVFGLIVIAVVGLMVLVPRLRSRTHHPSQHEMYFGDLEQPRAAAPGAPRATSPNRIAAQQAAAQPSAPQGEAPQPLKLPH